MMMVKVMVMVMAMVMVMMVVMVMTVVMVMVATRDGDNLCEGHSMELGVIGMLPHIAQDLQQQVGGTRDLR
jgi:hypothetical protein